MSNKDFSNLFGKKNQRKTVGAGVDLLPTFNAGEPVMAIPGTELKKINIDEIEPAPSGPQWNFFSDASEDRVIEIATSLFHEGQFAPIIVREYEYEDKSKRFQCLSGHTRLRSARYLTEIAEELKGQEGREEDTEKCAQWQYLNAFVYPLGACSDLEARRKIIHPNTKQRPSMSPKEKLQSFNFAILDVEGAKNTSAIMKDMMDHFGIQKSHAYNLNFIRTNAIGYFLDLALNGYISNKDALIVAHLDKELQQYLADNYKDRLIELKFKQLSKVKTAADIDRIFNKQTDSFQGPVVTDHDREWTTYSLQIPNKADKDFIKAMQRLYHKYGLVMK